MELGRYFACAFSDAQGVTRGPVSTRWWMYVTLLPVVERTYVAMLSVAQSSSDTAVYQSPENRERNLLPRAHC